MRRISFMLFARAFCVLVSAIIFMVFSAPVHAQDDAYWMGLPTKNPAAIGSPTDWVYGGYFFSNFDNAVSGYSGGIDYQISPKIGTLGFNFDREEFGLERIYQFQLNYAYTFSFFEKGQISVGAAVGVMNYKNDLTQYYSYYEPSNYDYGGNYYGYGGYTSEPLDVNLEPVWVHLKSSLGWYFLSDRLDLGMSYSRWDELEDEINDDSDYYSFKSPGGVFSLLGAYRIQVNGKLRVEPNLLLDFEDGNTDTYAGVFFKYRSRFWAGYSSLDFDELHSVMAGCDIKGKYRLGYSYNFPKLFDGDYLNYHEFILAFRLK